MLPDGSISFNALLMHFPVVIGDDLQWGMDLAATQS